MDGTIGGLEVGADGGEGLAAEGEGEGFDDRLIGLGAAVHDAQQGGIALEVVEEKVEGLGGDVGHVYRGDDYELGLEVLEGGEDAAQRPGSFFGVDEFAVEGVRARRIVKAGGGDQEPGPRPGEAVEEVDEDGLTIDLKEGFRPAHAGASAAGEDGEGDLFARGHGKRV